MASFQEHPHRRFNILTGEWILVSPYRTKRPWQDKNEKPYPLEKVSYDENCYLCPGNKRVGEAANPNYKTPYALPMIL